MSELEFNLITNTFCLLNCVEFCNEKHDEAARIMRYTLLKTDDIDKNILKVLVDNSKKLKGATDLDNEIIGIITGDLDYLYRLKEEKR